jgi:hypothetical protein
LTNVDPRFLASLVAACCFILWTPAGQTQAPVKTVAQFTTGEIRFTQGGRAYSASLSTGRIDVVEELAGEAPLEARTLYLQFTFLTGGAGAQPDVTLVLKNADGPGDYGASDLLAFVVQTSGGGISTFQADRGSCNFVLTRLGRGGVDGTARCSGAMTGAGGGQGPLVTDVSFNARP